MQLMSQMGNTTPPATAAEIAALPTINICADHLGQYGLEFLVSLCININFNF